MKKFFTAAVLFFALCICASAQVNSTVFATVSAGGTNNNVYSAVGQPFFQQYDGNNIALSDGVAQAQLITNVVEDSLCQNDSYTDNGFSLSDLEPGVHSLENYQDHVAEQDNYDVLNKLTLTVFEIYNVDDQRMYHADELPIIDGELLQNGQEVQLVEGWNELNYKSIHGCDSVVHYFVLLCPLSVDDADNFSYNTVIMNDFHCYTRENLRTEHYSDCDASGAQSKGSEADNLVYNSMLYPDEEYNLATFGRLYTYNVATFGEPDAQGYIQGICPCGWHIPTAEETALLRTYDKTELNSKDFWVEPNFNTNSTKFSALPAGYYNAESRRFEDMMSETKFWYIGKEQDSAHNSLSIKYFCDSPIIENFENENAYSVRCVRNNLEK